MKFVIDRKTLGAAVAAVEKAASSRQIHPALEGIRLQASARQLRLTATDLTMTLEADVEAEVEDPGDLVLNAKLLCQFVRRLEGSRVELELQDDHVALVCGSSRLSLHYLPSDQFPEPVEMPDAAEWQISGPALRELIRRTLFSVSDDPSRPSLTGILVEASPEELRLVATDGNRLALARHVWDAGESAPSKPLSAIVPTRAMAELLRAGNEDPDVSVQVRLDSRQARFSAPGWTMTTRLIEGQFPSYRRTIPASQPIQVALPRQPLLAALERAALLSDRGEPAFVRLTLADGILRLTSQTQDIGRMQDELAIDYTGQEFSSAYQVHFWTDVLQAYSGDQILWGVSEPMSPATIRPAGDDSTVSVIMPVRDI